MQMLFLPKEVRLRVHVDELHLSEHTLDRLAEFRALWALEPRSARPLRPHPREWGLREVEAMVGMLPEKPLHGAPFSALQRFHKRGSGRQSDRESTQQLLEYETDMDCSSI